MLIWGLIVWMIYEGVLRLLDTEHRVDGKYMLGTAIFGLFVNIVMMKILHS